MTTRPTGPNLFFGAITDLVRHPGAVAKIAALPLAVFLAIEIWTARAYVDWLNDTDWTRNPPSEILSNLGFFLMVGVLAVSWHRFMLLAEAPGAVGPGLHWKNWLKYILGWIIISIVVGLGVLIGVALPLILIAALIDPVLGQIALSVLSPNAWIDDPTGAGTFWLLGLIGALIVYAYLYLIFRVSMGLPAVAIGADAPPGLRASFARTAPLAVPLLGLTVFALVGQAILSGSGFLLLGNPGFEENYRVLDEVLVRVALALTDTVNTLIGAAILTRVYRALPGVEEEAD